MNTYTTVQVAKMLKIGRDTIYRWIRSAKIRGARATRVGNLRLRLWSDQDVAEVRRYMMDHHYKSLGKRRKRKK
jgi:excisionase family DNA binding protein